MIINDGGNELPAIEDEFNKETRFHVSVSKDMKVAERKQIYENGGLIYLK